MMMKKLLALALFALATPAWAADTKISALPSASALSGPEQIAGVQSAATVKITATQINTYVQGNVPTLVGDSGSGGTKGLAPAPASGDAAAGKFLGAGGTWTVPSGGVSTFPGYVATRWYQAAPSRTLTGIATTADTVRLYPYVFLQTATISDLGVRVTTSTASTNVRLTLYAASASTKKPTGTALSSCTVATTSIAVLTCTLGANVQVTAGTLYWLGAQSDNSTVVFTVVDSQAGKGTTQDMIGTTTVSSLIGATQFTGYSAPATYAGGNVDLTSATFTEQNSATIPVQVFKITSVP